MQATALWVLGAQGSGSKHSPYPLTARTFKRARDKWGRYIADLFVVPANTLTDHLLRGGHDAPKKG